MCLGATDLHGAWWSWEPTPSTEREASIGSTYYYASPKLTPILRGGWKLKVNLWGHQLVNLPRFLFATSGWKKLTNFSQMCLDEHPCRLSHWRDWVENVETECLDSNRGYASGFDIGLSEKWFTLNNKSSHPIVQRLDANCEGWGDSETS